MFFRRVKPHVDTFDEYVVKLKKSGFDAQSLGDGRLRVVRDGFAAIVTVSDLPTHRHVKEEGLLMGDEIGVLVNGGYQQFFATVSGKRRAALADQLKALHAFDEDLREAVGILSLYNEGLGTTSERHMYDRVQGREV
jgi:hypothetical protein